MTDDAHPSLIVSCAYSVRLFQLEAGAQGETTDFPPNYILKIVLI